MESGLDGRNNEADTLGEARQADGLNGVRPRWPEQWQGRQGRERGHPQEVSMESGLDGRNNFA